MTEMTETQEKALWKVLENSYRIFSLSTAMSRFIEHEDERLVKGVDILGHLADTIGEIASKNLGMLEELHRGAC